MAARKKASGSARLKLIEAALRSDDPLGNIREIIAEKNQQQQTVVWVFACILETGSAGLSIMFDRFSSAELAKLDRGLVEIGATETADDLRALRAAVDEAAESGKSREDAAESVSACAQGRAVDRKHEAHVKEMETKLLAYCEEHVGELAAG